MPIIILSTYNVHGCRMLALTLPYSGTTSTCGQPVPKENTVTCNSGMNLCRDGVCSGSICLVMGLLDCECTAERQQCHVCCMDRTNMMCSSSFDLFGTTLGQARPAGHTCSNSQGYCDSNGE